MLLILFVLHLNIDFFFQIWGHRADHTYEHLIAHNKNAAKIIYNMKNVGT